MTGSGRARQRRRARSAAATGQDPACPSRPRGGTLPFPALGPLVPVLVALLLAAGIAFPVAARDAPPSPPRAAEDSAAREADDAFTIRPLLRVDADAASFFGQDEPGGFRSGVALRRGRVGARGGFARDFSFTLLWEFGGGDPRDASGPYEAQVAYAGLGWGTVRFGAFKLRHLPEFAMNSFDLLFLERAAITDLAGSVASGTSRAALGLEAHGERWAASGYATSGTISTPHDDGQRGLVGRMAALVLAERGAQLQLGINGAYQFSPPGGAASFADYPEVRVDSRQFLRTGDIPARGSWAWGPEAAGRLGPLYLEAVFQRVGADAGDGRGDRHFSGWYVQGAVPLLGPPRERDADSATWARPAVRDPFRPAAGHWGALELAARFSSADLRDGATRGGQQRSWTAGLNFYPRRDLRLAAFHEHGRVALDGRDRGFRAVLLRASFNL